MWEGPKCPDCMSRAAHSRDLRRNRVTDVPDTFFITKSLHPKKPVIDAHLREIVVSALQFAIQQDRAFLRAFVVMPDHWHALFALREPWTLPRFMHAIMSFVAARTHPSIFLHATNWQDGYHDTRIRTARQFAYVQHYIVQNPVERGLVQHPEEWPASSAARTE